METNRQIAEENYRLQQQTIVNEVKKAYYDLLQTQSGLEATQEAIRLFRELERVAGEALKQQAVLKSDLMDAQYGLAKVEADAVTLSNTSATLKEKINGLIGRDLITDFTVADVPDDELLQMDLAAARARAVQQRPELQQARLKIEQAELDRRVKKAEYIPDVSFSYLYVSPFNIEVLPKNVSGAGLTVSWDVFDWGRKKRELASKTRTIEQARTGVQEAESQILLEVGHKFRTFQEAKAKLRVAELARDSATEKFRVATNQYKEQAVQLKDLLQQQASLAEAQYKHRESLLAFWTARTDLEKAIGER
jgi:outer membrane protein TolC